MARYILVTSILLFILDMIFTTYILKTRDKSIGSVVTSSLSFVLLPSSLLFLSGFLTQFNGQPYIQHCVKYGILLNFIVIIDYVVLQLYLAS